MLKINKLQFCLSVTAASIVATSSASVFAIASTGTNSDASTTPAASTTSGTSEVSSSTELHRRGDGLLADLKKTQGNKTKTAEQRKKVCEAHKDGLASKFKHIVTNSQKTQARIDAIYAKGLAFGDSSGTQPAGYAGLVSSANSAKANSSASIAALQAITPTIDCSSSSTASDVAAFKAAAQQTRDNLKAYRTAVKAVLQALETTKPSVKGSN